MKNSVVFYEKLSIFHNFFAPKTSQQNGVVERKNRFLEELVITILSESSLPNYFWIDVVSTTCYVMNMVLVRSILKKTTYELFNGRKLNIDHLKVFDCKCYILNNGKGNLDQFDEKADSGIFLGYSLTSHAYRVYNKILMTVDRRRYLDLTVYPDSSPSFHTHLSSFSKSTLTPWTSRRSRHTKLFSHSKIFLLQTKFHSQISLFQASNSTIAEAFDKLKKNTLLTFDNLKSTFSNTLRDSNKSLV